jgi:hypothetical protein
VRLVCRPKGSHSGIVTAEALRLSDDAFADLRERLRPAAVRNFEHFLEFLDSNVGELGGDAAKEIARLKPHSLSSGAADYPIMPLVPKTGSTSAQMPFASGFHSGV